MVEKGHQSENKVDQLLDAVGCYANLTKAIAGNDGIVGENADNTVVDNED